MTFAVETKDCTALADAELADMADIVTDGPAGFDIGLLSKQAEAWVLITQIRDVGKLVGFSFCTLERIGGTPCLLWGLASVKRNAKRDQVLKAIISAQFRRAVLAFPPVRLAAAEAWISRPVIRSNAVPAASTPTPSTPTRPATLPPAKARAASSWSP